MNESRNQHCYYIGNREIFEAERFRLQEEKDHVTGPPLSLLDRKIVSALFGLNITTAATVETNRPERRKLC